MAFRKSWLPRRVSGSNAEVGETVWRGSKARLWPISCSSKVHDDWKYSNQSLPRRFSGLIYHTASRGMGGGEGEGGGGDFDYSAC